MKISVAMTTYNGEQYIEEQLDSLRLQTVPADEVIICDDRSKDRTADIVRSYIERYDLGSYWQFIVNENNLGYCDNFHHAASACRGDLVFFCDQDDIWRLNKLEIMADVMEKRPEIKALYSDYQNFNTQEEKVFPSMTECGAGKIEKTVLSKNTIYLHTIGCAMVIRREFLREMEPYWYSGFAHDECVWKLGLCSGGLFHLSTVLLDRRCHGNNASMKKMRSLNQRTKYVDDLLASYQAMMKYSDEYDSITPQQRTFIAHNMDGCRMRLEMLRRKAVWKLPQLLLRYCDTVKTPKTMLIEAYYGLKG